jgi:hypothetical protein
MKHQYHKTSTRFFVYQKSGDFFSDLKGVENFGVMQRVLEEIEGEGGVVIVNVDEYIPLVSFRYTSEKAHDRYHNKLLSLGSRLDHGVGAPLMNVLRATGRKFRLRAAFSRV